MFTVAFMRFPPDGNNAKPYRVDTFPSLTRARLAASGAGVSDFDLASINKGIFTLNELPDTFDEGWGKSGKLFSSLQ